MTDGLAAAAVTAFWLGILTSISPCPLATNIAAVTFISRRVGHAGWALLAGVGYTLGRAAAYLAVGGIVVAGILSIPGVSQFLQRYMNKLVGPILVIVGMFLLDLLRVNLPFGQAGGSEGLRERAAKSGFWGATLLGALFALSFCPVSAALFFGSLVPLSIRHESRILLPLLFGIGTGLPVVAVAALVASGESALARAFHRITAVEKWARLATGLTFVVVGIYLSIRFIFLA